LQYLYINGRWIRDRSLAHAIQEAYRGLLMTGRYPVTILFIDMPPDEVDVNVHPTKTEVRFRDAQAVYHLVFGSIRERLRAENLTARLFAPPHTGFAATNDSRAIPANRDALAPPFAAESRSSPIFHAPSSPVETPNGHAVQGEAGWAPDSATHVAEEVSTKAIQLYDSYIVLETPEGMLVVDQHALHERILFEQLKRRIQITALERQRLLIPEPIDLTAEQAAKERPPSREALLNDLLSLMACHAAVRAGDRLSHDEMIELLSQRALADDTHHCPHGRPTSLLFSKAELDRQFRRT
jgi:DNA mismatch repair protein MutL